MNDIAERLVRKQTKNESDIDYLMYQLEKVELFKNIFQYSTMKMSKDFLESLETVRIPKSSVIFAESTPMEDYSYLVLKGQIIILTRQPDRLNRRKIFDTLLKQFRIAHPTQYNVSSSLLSSSSSKTIIPDIRKDFSSTYSSLISPSQQKNVNQVQSNLNESTSSTLTLKQMTNKSQINAIHNQIESNSNSISQSQDKLNLLSQSNEYSKSSEQQQLQQSQQSSPLAISQVQNKQVTPSLIEGVKSEFSDVQEQFGNIYGLVNEGNLFGEESICNGSSLKDRVHSYTAIAGSDTIIALINSSLVNHILCKIDEMFSGSLKKGYYNYNYNYTMPHSQKLYNHHHHHHNNNNNNNIFERKNRSHSPILNQIQKKVISQSPGQQSQVLQVPGGYQQFYKSQQENKMSAQDKIDYVKKIYVTKKQNYIIKDRKSIKQLFQKEVQQDKSISYSHFLQNNQTNRSLEKVNQAYLVISASSIKQKI